MTGKEELQKFTIQVNKEVTKFLNSLDSYKYDHLIEKIFSLEDEPLPAGCTKLNIIDGYRIKWSDYRILYKIDFNNKNVIIFRVGHRKDIYRKR
ncbi:MAG: type II toxin-antitoxin system RelE/ParE family toxin [Ignavibacteriae bacterium]|nr:type II toxin-antitoxin system RelE/ParE family toxin [Ignavibacteriota bacterium]